jgi:hypothetical protein
MRIGTIDAESQFMEIGSADDQRSCRPQPRYYCRIALLDFGFDRLGAGGSG